MSLSFEDKLQHYAQLTIRIGLGVQPGQRVLIQAPVETAPLARLLVREAYAAGASFVDVRWDDDDVQLSRYTLAPDNTFELLSRWRIDAELENAQEGGAVLAIRATDPNLFSKVEPSRVSTQQKAWGKYRRPYMQQVMTNRLNWNLITAPLPAPSNLIFPDVAPETAIGQYWDAIFAATRADQPDPIAAWQAHLEGLKRRREILTGKQYTALRFRSAQTDLTVGLADGHVWGGGSSETPGGIVFTPNIPTEEVFTAPHRERVDGAVVSTKPLAYNGVLIEGIRMEFREGRVVKATAQAGESTLQQLLSTDEGSARLGEVALVAHSSPISRSGLFFYNTLYDENAASHIALGSAYRTTVRGGADMTEAQFSAAGGNDSLSHVDWMIGSADMDVDGLSKDGSHEAVMRSGEFVI